MKLNHIITKSAFEDKSVTRWYDNSDLSDVIFAIFNKRFADNSICLQTYKAGVGGFKNFKLQDNKFKAEFVAANEKPLEGKVAYHPILSVGTSNTKSVKEMFDYILNGIDSGQDGMPSLILIPVLMHNNHFSIVAVEPNAEKSLAKVSFFNSMGTKGTYQDEEDAIMNYMSSRYPGCAINSNTDAIYQYDCNSCGPFVTEFATKATQLVNQKISVASKFNKENQHCGMEVLGKKESLDRVLEIRQNHAGDLSSKVQSNYSFMLFIQAMEMLENGVTNNQVEFENDGVSINEYQKACGITPTMNGIKVKKIGGIDAFELQQGSVEWYLAHQSGIAQNPVKTVDIKIAVGVLTGLALSAAGIGLGVRFL